jgi:hypothetical protein
MGGGDIMFGFDFDETRCVMNYKYVSQHGRVECRLVGCGEIRNGIGPSSAYNSKAGFPNIHRNKYMKKQLLRLILNTNMIVVKLIDYLYKANGSRNSSVGIVTDYAVRFSVGASIFFSPRLPDWPWGRTNFLSNDYLGDFPGGKAAGALNSPLTSN